MSESKHTPGPWYYFTGEDIPDYWIPGHVSAECWVIVTGGMPPEEVDFVCGEDHGTDPQRPLLADARLIAAAPDLLAVCKRLADFAGWRPGLTGTVDSLTFAAIASDSRDAITKATGAE